jgi:hypothetical protein
MTAARTLPTRRVLTGDEANGGLHSGRGAPGSIHELFGPQSLRAGVDLQEGSGRLADNGGWIHPGSS